ncbi:hypothetical protein E3U55_08205 [Filobacillus milosensis]|uniref:Uncharacterized protein n=2 Tax=Filobacillus milosensis TaxID=94137 RepID=A0A4Y8ISP5_9BACI|nr:hypothetical protein E3U55_08205 [Filobacillus milosensis]
MYISIIGVSVVLLTSLVIYWYFPQPDHKLIASEEIDAIHTWTYGNNIKQVDVDEYISIIELFNQHPNDETSIVDNIPEAESGIIIDVESPAEGRETIIIHYANDNIFVERTDVNRKSGKYVLKDASEEMKEILTK